MEQWKEDISERMELAIGRIEEIPEEVWDTEKAEFLEAKKYFDTVSEFILYLYDVSQVLDSLVTDGEESAKVNRKLYEDILPENYDKSYGNPDFAVERLGEQYGQMLSFLYAEIRSCIAFCFEKKFLPFVALAELFLEIYHMYDAGEDDLPKPKYIRDAIYYHMYDYADVLVAGRIAETVSKENSFATDVIMESDLSDLAYLYRYGEYIGGNEIRTAQFLNSLEEEKVKDMAKTCVDGFIKGFETMRIDIKPKKTVNIRYAIGQERMVRYIMELFRDRDLSPVIYRYAVSRSNRKLTIRTGFSATPANKQYEYDHRMDEALFFDRAFMERKLRVMEDTYEKNKEAAKVYAGPAVIEVFGENPFKPVVKDTVLRLSEKQQEMAVEYAARSAEISNRYIPREKTSFTIIAYPIPEIGDRFEEIFAEIVKVNTLDNELYKKIQQTLIDELDRAKYVEVRGQNGNKTDLKVMLHTIDPKKETNFENCLADVNIPVGEVFTSPVLSGTDGILHVSQVYLNELKYSDLCIRFRDGRIEDYTCGNFEDEEENKAFVRENLMFNHKTLPIGEFAIGTNTTAYVMAQKYKILYKLPILIVEKMGPHFAVGDTCYSYSEESRLYNPDGKEIVAKDNECSVLRKTGETEKAYFNCHTDITIPYEEIGEIDSVHEDGTKVAILRNGRFVLPGTEILNEPFENQTL